jgi:FkbM family methyltransferase
MLEFIKLAKNPRIGFRNAILITRDLLRRRQEVCLEPTEWYDKISLRPDNSDYEVFNQIFRFTSYGALEKLGQISTVIDAGANIGLSSMYFSKRLNYPEIVGLEPEDSNYRQASLNTGDLPRVTMLKKALWSKNRMASIANPETSSWDFRIEADDQGDVECVSVSQILAEKNWQNVDLLKIDIEGAEKEIFESEEHLAWINRVKILVIELHDFMVPGCSLAFFKAISKLESIEMMLSGENLVIRNLKLL